MFEGVWTTGEEALLHIYRQHPGQSVNFQGESSAPLTYLVTRACTGLSSASWMATHMKTRHSEYTAQEPPSVPHTCMLAVWSSLPRTCSQVPRWVCMLPLIYTATILP